MYFPSHFLSFPFPILTVSFPSSSLCFLFPLLALSTPSPLLSLVLSPLPFPSLFLSPSVACPFPVPLTARARKPIAEPIDGATLPFAFPFLFLSWICPFPLLLPFSFPVLSVLFLLLLFPNWGDECTPSLGYKK